MTTRLVSLKKASSIASEVVGLDLTTDDVRLLVKYGLLPAMPPSGSSRSVSQLCQAHPEQLLFRRPDLETFSGMVRTDVPHRGLFGDPFDLSARRFPAADKHDRTTGRQRTPKGRAVFVLLSPSLAVSFEPSESVAEILQLFVAKLRTALPGLFGLSRGTGADRSLSHVDIDPGATVWSSESLPRDALAKLWQESVFERARTTIAESLTIAPIYGCKSRMTSFLAAVVSHFLPADGLLLDLMSGSGAATRQFAKFWEVYANDANPFACLLTRCHDLGVRPADAAKWVNRIQEPYAKNLEAVSKMLREALREEAHYLHAEITPELIEQYRDFCNGCPAPAAGSADPAGRAEKLAQLSVDRRAAPRTFPYCMTTALYANAYFGLLQSVQIDSLRYAIDVTTGTEALRRFGLGALVLTAHSCGSGPHFAQPPRISGPKAAQAMAEIVEHRARDISAEYVLNVRLLAGNQLPNGRMKDVWCKNWPEALDAFRDVASRETGRPAAVYVDPPYTKLQYSRYYHVLNTLIEYDYPVCKGVGRYPPRTARFSSRFEYQKSSSAREFSDLFRACSSQRLTTLVSYSDSGLVPIAALVRSMDQAFGEVHLFSRSTRHRSQGVRLGQRQRVTEYVLVGVPG